MTDHKTPSTGKPAYRTDEASLLHDIRGYLRLISGQLERLSQLIENQNASTAKAQLEILRINEMLDRLDAPHPDPDPRLWAGDAHDPYRK